MGEVFEIIRCFVPGVSYVRMHIVSECRVVMEEHLFGGVIRVPKGYAPLTPSGITVRYFGIGQRCSAEQVGMTDRGRGSLNIRCSTDYTVARACAVQSVSSYLRSFHPFNRGECRIRIYADSRALALVT